MLSLITGLVGGVGASALMMSRYTVARSGHLLIKTGPLIRRTWYIDGIYREIINPYDRNNRMHISTATMPWPLHRIESIDMTKEIIYKLMYDQTHKNLLSKDGVLFKIPITVIAGPIHPLKDLYKFKKYVNNPPLVDDANIHEKIHQKMNMVINNLTYESICKYDKQELINELLNWINLDDYGLKVKKIILGDIQKTS